VVWGVCLFATCLLLAVTTPSWGIKRLKRMSGAGFDARSGVLKFKRATIPQYRDIRDRPTWELLDVLYWDNDAETDYGGGIETAATSFNATGIQGSYVRRVLRRHRDGTLFYDGTRQMSQLSLPFGSNTNDKLALLEDFYMVGEGNSQNLHANGLASFDGFGVQAGAQIRWIALFNVLPEPIREQFIFLFEEDQSTDVSNLPAYNLSVTSASGSWTGATNVIINPRAYDFETAQQPIEIYRAIN